MLQVSLLFIITAIGVSIVVVAYIERAAHRQQSWRVMWVMYGLGLTGILLAAADVSGKVEAQRVARQKPSGTTIEVECR